MYTAVRTHRIGCVIREVNTKTRYIYTINIPVCLMCFLFLGVKLLILEIDQPTAAAHSLLHVHVCLCERQGETSPNTYNLVHWFCFFFPNCFVLFLRMICVTIVPKRHTYRRIKSKKITSSFVRHILPCIYCSRLLLACSHQGIN